MNLKAHVPSRPSISRRTEPTTEQRIADAERADGVPGRIPRWIAETHARAADARAELLRRIASRLDAPRPGAGR